MSDLVKDIRLSMYGMDGYTKDSALWYIDYEYMPCVNKISDILPNLSTIFAKNDFALVDKLRFGGYKFIRNPDSFNSSMKQVAETVWNVLSVCLTSMDDIQMATRGSNDRWNSAKCKGKSAAMESKVTEMIDLLGEFLEASTSTKALTERDANILKIEISTAENQRQKASRDEKEAKDEYAMWKSRVDRAQDSIQKAQSVRVKNGRNELRSRICYRPLKSGEFDSMIRFESSAESRDDLKEEAENVKMVVCDIVDTVTNSSLNKGYLIYDQIRGQLRELHHTKDLLDNILRDIYFGDGSGPPVESTRDLCKQVTRICNGVDKMAEDLRTANKTQLYSVIRSAHDLKCKAIELEIDVAYDLAEYPSASEGKLNAEEALLDDGTLLDLTRTPKELKDYGIKLALDKYYSSNEEFEKQLNKLREAENKRKEIEFAIQTLSTVRQPELDHRIGCLNRAISHLQVLRLEFGKLLFIFQKCTFSLKTKLQESDIATETPLVEA